ncbi:hypothetical protein [Thioalkalivibrio sulfidiphilus]|uniref:hypothetical protein n=1 Tax=Thioalkalivibrio sulfidiphilus TaxID=1033854 RepID=UPI000363A392|nr:hypothetical protein [Thioalkalivibrio sulfidiphilus]
MKPATAERRREAIIASIKRRKALRLERLRNFWRITGPGVRILVKDLALLVPRDLDPPGPHGLE